MSNSSWSGKLTGALTKNPSTDNPAVSEPVRFALMGVGNELNGDDAAGVRVVQALRAKLEPRPTTLLIEAGPAPENFTGPLRRFQPELVVIVDAANFGAEPGAVRWIEWQEIDGLSASTHTLPPSILAAFLIEELGCRVALLGIQAGNVEFGQPMAAEVEAAVEAVAHELGEILSQQ